MPAEPPDVAIAMDTATLAISYAPGAVALSYLVASFASYVALDLARRVRSTDRAMALCWWVGGSVAMGSGIWSMHFIGMQAAQLPFAVGYAYLATALSWVAAVVASAVALAIASGARLSAWRLTGGALVTGLGICAMHYTGMAAVVTAPGIRWQLPLVAASAGVAVAASAVSLLIFFWLRRFVGAAARAWQAVAAAVMGAAICGMHYTGMAAAAFADSTVCLSAGQLRGDSLGVLVAAVAILLLSLTLLASAIDARLQGQAAGLTASLQIANAELRKLAFRDALTGLPNRLLFDDRVASAVARCTRDRTTFAVLFVDVDGFKPVNDSFGHACGDTVLREMARRLEAGRRVGDTVARIGGDEFVLLLDGNSDREAIAQRAVHLIDALTAPVAAGDHEMRLSCSIGIARFPADGPHAQLIAHADAAMYAAKRAGGATFAFFEAHMNADVHEQVELQRDLRQAIERGELELHYQPKVSAAQPGVIAGVEALARWRHPQCGPLSPAVFIAIAERFGLIGALGNWVIEQACEQMRDWNDSGLRLRVAINLSVHQLRQADLPERVAQALASRGLDPSLLTFEITESAAMDDAERTIRTFQRLRRIGIQLSIDDFGTGYSSLSYLRRLPVDQLKIDRSFVQELATSADARAIVQAIVQLAHALKLVVVAEGVETAAQRDVLTRLGCDQLQGFLLARPMPPQTMAQWAVDVGRPAGLQFAESATLPM